MISSAVRIVSNAICVLLIASFAMFVVDELTTASSQQLAVANDTAKAQTIRDVHGREINLNRTALRTKLDSANDAVLAPAEALVADQGPWVMRTVPFLLGLLFFGLGGHMLARWLDMKPKRMGPAPIDRDLRPRYTQDYR